MENSKHSPCSPTSQAELTIFPLCHLSSLYTLLSLITLHLNELYTHLPSLPGCELPEGGTVSLYPHHCIPGA